jgi:ribose-phosphate pyrophosphokinase
MLLAGGAHPDLAKAVAARLGVHLGDVSLGKFANGEISVKLNESVRGHEVFVLQSHAGDVNRAIMEQLLMIDAAKRSSAQCITAVCPFMGYARQDRKSSGREPIAARLLVDMLRVAGADRVISIDLHSGQAQGFFDGPFDHLIAMPILRQYIADQKIKDLMLVSPDAGRVKLTERYASQLNCDMAIIHKHRSMTQHNTAEARFLIGEVEGKNCVMVDDMIDTAGTICTAAELLMKNGAKSVIGVATHGILSDPALERIKNSVFKKIVVTDTLPIKVEKGSKIEVLSVAQLLADSISAVFSGGSVSAIFGGLNQS